MERIIKLSDLAAAVDAAYEKFKSVKDGAVDPRLQGTVNEKDFGIAVCLADGTVIKKGDVEVASPLGDIIKIPLSSVLLSQNSVQDIIKKSGACCCACKKGEKPAVPVSPHGVRAISAMQPVGDPDSKWNFLENRMIDMMGSAPVLNDKLYESMKAANITADTVNAFAKANYELYDDAAVSVDLYTRAESMTATAMQLAIMGATIAADGVNPATNTIAFDGALSQRIVAMMAVKGPHKMSRPWLLMSGIPAKSSFGGAMVGVIPGVLSIAAYSPMLNEKGISIKAAKSIVDIMNSLQISALSSAKVRIEK